LQVLVVLVKILGAIGQLQLVLEQADIMLAVVVVVVTILAQMVQAVQVVVVKVQQQVDL
jgi:hypothetical protein